MHTTFWSENLKEKDHLKDLNVNDRMILKWILEKQFASVWTGSVWLRIETDGLLL
jgi:hypothetical protein